MGIPTTTKQTTLTQPPTHLSTIITEKLDYIEMSLESGVGECSHAAASTGVYVGPVLEEHGAHAMEALPSAHCKQTGVVVVWGECVDIRPC